MNIAGSIICLILLLAGEVFAKSQPRASANYLSGIKNHDLNKLWFSNPDKKDADILAVTHPTPLGIIGENCQRFYIHYTAVTKCKTNSCQYNVTGKTRVKENICGFSGTITITKTRIYTKQFDYRYKQGFVECAINFKEDTTQVNSGIFTGKLVTTFYLDEKRMIEYDDLLFGADLYFNNQVQATWTSYATYKSKKVKWGDYRIPGNTGFDVGDGEFMIDDKYVKNGWQNYKAARSGDPENAATKNAESAEAIEWWK